MPKVPPTKMVTNKLLDWEGVPTRPTKLDNLLILLDNSQIFQDKNWTTIFSTKENSKNLFFQQFSNYQIERECCRKNNLLDFYKTFTLDKIQNSKLLPLPAYINLYLIIKIVSSTTNCVSLFLYFNRLWASIEKGTYPFFTTWH